MPRSFSLSRREADIAITIERPTEGRLVAQKLVDYSLGLYASTAYAEANGLPHGTRPNCGRTVSSAMSRISSSARRSTTRTSSVRDWDAAFAISSALGQVEAVRSGAGIGILHTFIARALPELVPVEAAQPIRRAYWLVYHESVRPLRRIQAVAGHIIQAVERERRLFQ